MSYKDLELANESNYFKLQSGENKLRIVSAPVKVWTAFDKESTDKKARKFLTEEAAMAYNSKMTDTKKQAKAKYAVWVIDRATDEIVMAEFGTMIMQAIKALALDSNYGFDGYLPPYDLKITRTGEEMNTRYTVLPLPASPLTEDEQKRIEAVGDLTQALREEVEDKSAVAPF